MHFMTFFFLNSLFLQSFLPDHIWMVLLLKTIFWEGPLLILFYLIVDQLYDASLVLEDFLFTVVFFRGHCGLPLWETFPKVQR